MAPTNGDEQRSPEEEAILDEVAERTGTEWAERHAQHIINQAELVGDL